MLWLSRGLWLRDGIRVGLHWRSRLGLQGAADGIDRQAGCLCDLCADAFGPADRAGFQLLRILRDNSFAKQLCIPPDMRVPLLFRQVKTVQVLGNLPKLGSDFVAINLNALNLLPAQFLGSSEAMPASDKNWDASGQMPIHNHLLDNANGYRLAQPNVGH